MFKKNTIKYKEKVINKFISLIDKGYDADYCFKKFPIFDYYKDDIKLYLNTINNIKGLKTIEPTDEFKNSLFEKITQNTNQYDKNLFINNYNSYKSSKFKKPFLKPVIVFLSAFLFLTFSYTGTVFASQNSIPGDVLYNVKKSAEVIQLSFTPYSKQGKLHFKFLNNRINEATIILNKNIILSDIEINNLLNSIDYEYKKCNEHNYLNNQDKQKINNEINTIKMQYQNRYRKRYGPRNSNINQDTTSSTSNNLPTELNTNVNEPIDTMKNNFNSNSYNQTQNNEQDINSFNKQNNIDQAINSKNNDGSTNSNANLNNSTEITNGLNKGFNNNNDDNGSFK